MRDAPIKPLSLPTEEDILEFLQNGSGDKRTIARAFGIKGSDRIYLKQLLKKMMDEGKIPSARRRIVPGNILPRISVIEIVSIDAQGEAIASPVTWNDELGARPRIQLKRPRTKGAPAAPGVGEQIVAELTALHKNTFAYQAKMIRRAQGTGQRVLGVFRKSAEGGGRLVPVDKKARQDFEVPPQDTNGALDGELVEADVRRDRALGLSLARIRTRLGDMDDRRNVSLIAIHEFGIPDQFSDTILDEVAALHPFSLKGRRDLQALPLITIDPRDARDHDDAIHAVADSDPANPGGFIVTVAIADVAAYVHPATALDREARRRGNSVYFPDRVVPMLPERISNDLCSLREGEARPALVCEMVFDVTGDKRSHTFSRAVMKSAAKFSYEDAQAVADGRRTHPLAESTIKPLWQAFEVLTRGRARRDPLDLDLPERKILVNEAGEMTGVVIPPRLAAHRLVEEFMIQANVAAAEQLEARRTAQLYRVHEEPSREKIEALGRFLKTLDLPIPKGQVLKSKHFNALLKQVEDKDYKHLVHEMILRTQAQAVYSPENRGHFGLSLSRYAHFTSPIRRYADLLIHRALITALGLGGDGLSEGDIENLEETATLISASERRAMAAERATIDRLVAQHLSDQVGATFAGRIGGVVGAGLFVRLNDIGADGFVPVSTLGREYYVFDETRHALVGQKTGTTFQLGDDVEVCLEEAAPVTGGMRFSMASVGRKGQKGARAAAARKPRRRH